MNHQAELILVCGGIRSGKSAFAVRLAKEKGGEVCFVATCVPEDQEMRQRIERHKALRPPEWYTIEESRDLIRVVKYGCGQCGVILVDCLGLWVSNLLRDKRKEKEILNETKGVCQEAKVSGKTVIFVSNEVGMMLTPPNPLGRKFVDILGCVNQIVAESADKVYLLFFGIPQTIKE